MGTGNLGAGSEKASLVEAFAGLLDPRVAGRSKYDLVEILVITVCAVVCGIDDFGGVEAWSRNALTGCGVS